MPTNKKKSLAGKRVGKRPPIKKLVWRKPPRDRGMPRQQDHGAILNVSYGPKKEDVAHVLSVSDAKTKKWYFIANASSFAIPLFNSINMPVNTLDEARDVAEHYVRRCLNWPKEP